MGYKKLKKEIRQISKLINDLKTSYIRYSSVRGNSLSSNELYIAIDYWRAKLKKLKKKKKSLDSTH